MHTDFVHPKFGISWNSEDGAEVAERYGKYHSDYWAWWLENEKGYDVQRVGVDEVFQSVRDEVEGAIVYRDPMELTVAATEAGLRNALPLTPAQHQQWTKRGQELSVLLDLRNHLSEEGTKDERRLAAHRWLIEHTLPRTNKDGVVSRVRFYNQDAHDSFVAVDLAVRQGWVTYHLDHTAKAHFPDREIDNPADKAVLDQVLEAIDDWSPVYGWGGPNENHFVRAASRHKLFVIGADVPNGSFFKALPSNRTEWNQARPHASPNNVEVEDKIYVAFMNNEGDTLKAAYGLMIDAGWLQPQRDQVPVAWGIDPFLIEEFPGLMEYYYDNQGPNDYFFAATSGYGYAHVPWIPEDGREEYAALVKAGVELADTPYADVWWTQQLEDAGTLGSWMVQCGFRGLTDWENGRQEVLYLEDDRPVIKSPHYYTLDTPESFAELLVKDYAEVQGPWLVVIYGAKIHGTPYRFNEVARRLPIDRFEVVGLDTLFAIAEKARREIEGRVWVPGPNAPKGVAP
jgi:hypothetical protein